MGISIEDVSRGRIHLVGVSSLELADWAVFLSQNTDATLIGHDIASEESLWESFRAAHIGMDSAERKLHWEALMGTGMTLCLGESYLQEIQEDDLFVVSQAWQLYPSNRPLIERLKKGQVKIVTPMELYLSIGRSRELVTVGVTGSNGKSTTVNMVASVLEAANRPFVLAGNYRYRGPILNRLAQLSAGDVLLLEVSNRHLEALEETVDVAIVTNVTENHIEEYRDFSEYIDVKRRMITGQFQEHSHSILNFDDPISSGFQSFARGRTALFSLESKDTDAFIEGGILFVRWGDETVRICSAASLSVLGEHNVANALAATLACFALGVEIPAVNTGLTAFQGVPGRLEHVRNVGDVSFYYDIESTTPEATIRALQSFPGTPVQLILGGEDKALNYDALSRQIKSMEVTSYLLPGSATELIRERLVYRKCSFIEADDLESAVSAAYKSAPAHAVVLLSPGARGFYNLYLRGQVSFKRMVKRLRAGVRAVRAGEQ